MENEIGKKLIEQSGKVLEKAYDDASHPALKTIGQIVALPFEALDAALNNAKLWVAERQYILERTRQLLAEKMGDLAAANRDSLRCCLAR